MLSARPSAHRSYLYVPADRPDRIAKAYDGASDAVVLELEDGVSPANKQRARSTCVEVLATAPPKPTYVRINALRSGHTIDDLLAVGPGNVEGIRLPKARSAADVRFVGQLLDELGSSSRIQVLLESAAAIEAVAEIARAHERVQGIGLGEQDLRADIGGDDDVLDHVRARIVLVSRAAGLPAPCQSVWPDLADEAGFRESCRRGRRLGYFGRSAIHPAQIGIIHDVYAPDPRDVDRLATLEAELEAAGGPGAGAFRSADGTFVDRAVVERARRAADPSGSHLGDDRG